MHFSSKLVENFAAIIQSGKHVILDNQSIIRVWVFRPPAGGGYLRTLDKNYLFEQSKAIKRCPLEAQTVCLDLFYYQWITHASTGA